MTQAATETPKPVRIAGRKLLAVLTEHGIIRPGDYVTRVVIDIPVDGAVRLYVERIGDNRLLDVVSTLNGVEIREEVRDAASLA